MNTKMNQTEWRAACRKFGDACRKVRAQLTRVRQSILAETRATLDSRERLVRLALNEAEALAWQTRYPHLLFPTLALEKVQAVAQWDARQRQIRQAALRSVAA